MNRAGGWRSKLPLAHLTMSKRKKWTFSPDDPQSANRGGSQWTRPRAQFCALYDKIGIFNIAIREAGYLGEEDGIPRWDADEGMILWMNNNRPNLAVLRRWAEELDEGKYVIPEGTRRRIDHRLANRFEATVREATMRVIRSNADTVSHLNKLALKNELSADMSPVLQHANNGVQNTVRALKEVLQKGDMEPTKKVGNRMLKRAKPKALPAGPPNATVAEFREVPSAAAS